MRALQDRVWAQMAKYMTNEASDEDREVISNLLRDNPIVANWYRELLVYYNTKEEMETEDTVLAFNQLEARIHQQTPLKKSGHGNF